MRLFILILTLLILQQGTAFCHPLHIPQQHKTKGFAVTAMGDTLRGYFYVNYYKGVLFNRDSKEQSANKNDSVLKNNDIRSVFLALGAIAVYNPGGFTEYDYFPKQKTFFRKIYTGKNDYYDGNIAIYDPNKICGELIIKNGYGKDILLVKKELAINRAKKLLTDYLNDKYNTHFAYKDFKNPIQVIREIEKRE